MSQKTKKGIRLAYGIFLSLLTVLSGLCLMAQCVRIHHSGSFTPEKVAAAFAPIAPVIYLFLALALIGLLLKPVWFPEGKHRPEKNHPLILRRLQSTTDLSACPEDLQKQVLALHRRRGYVWAVQCILLLACGGLTLRYAMDADNFHLEHINESMVQAMTFMLPCLSLPFVYGIFSAYYQRHSFQQEIILLKTAPAEAKRPAPLEIPKTPNLLWLKLILLACAVVLMCCGYYLGGWQDVLTKAVNICTECVGLG